MQIALWIVGVVVALFALDRLGVWAESKGWIYWRRKPQSGAIGAALMELNSFTNPAAEHVVVAKDAKKLEEKDNGDDDPPPP